MSESSYVNRCLKNTWERTMIPTGESRNITKSLDLFPLKDEKNSKKWERYYLDLVIGEVRKIIIIDIKKITNFFCFNKY